jgi:hypothetical protein
MTADAPPMRYFCGIDPGLLGAIALIDARGACKRLVDTPRVGGLLDFNALFDVIDTCPDATRFWVEVQHSLPGNRPTSTFSIGETYGAIRGILAALRLPYSEVRASVWQRAMLTGVPGEDTKARSVRAASTMFPGETFITPRGRVLDGRADALLIAEYGRRKGTGA